MNIDNWTLQGLKDATQEFCLSQHQVLVTEEHEEESKDKSPRNQDHDNDDDYVDISKLNNFEDAPKVTVRKYAPT